jgi:non-ribosomal peptide synthetase component F
LEQQLSGAHSLDHSYEDVVGMFEARAERHAGSTAVEFEADLLTYSDLNRMANGLAGLLVEHGVMPGARVVICLDPSPLTAVAILGVLKAGGAYVPVSPSDPVNRIAYVLADAAASVLLTDGRHLPRFGQLDTNPIVLDRPGDFDGDNVSRVVDSQRTAYVLYTSGSSSACARRSGRWICRSHPRRASPPG